MSLTAEALAAAIEEAGNWNLPHELAERLLPFIERHIAAGLQGESDLLDDLARIYATIPKLPVTAETAEEATNALLAFCYLPAVRKALDLQILPPAPLGDAEDYLRPLRNAIDTADAYATGGPRNLRIVTLRMDEAEAMLARASLATPQTPKSAGDSLSLHGAAGRSVSRAAAGAVPLPERPALPNGIRRETLTAPGSWTVQEAGAIRAYGDAREAAGRAVAVPLVDASFEAFNEITGLCSNLREGGPVPEDLEGLSSGLESAIDIAANMLAKISDSRSAPTPQQPAAAGACICDGATYAPDQRHPFLVNRACPRHGGPTPAADAGGVTENRVIVAAKAISVIRQGSDRAFRMYMDDARTAITAALAPEVRHGE